MLKTRLLHPGILAALGEAGHGAQVLIADGNYPLLTRSNAAAHRVYLNLAPGLVTVTDVLKVLVDAIPIEAAHVMVPDTGEEPGIFAEFRELLPDTPLQALGPLTVLRRGPRTRPGAGDRHRGAADLRQPAPDHRGGDAR